MLDKYQALGFIETIGMVPALYATDSMLKAAHVELISYENIGSTLVTIMIGGDIAAVNTAVEAGARAASIGTLTAKNVIPRPIQEVSEIVSLYRLEEIKREDLKRYNALGLVEAFGIVYVLQAADAMKKAANVKLLGFENVASGYISILVEGDVDACRTAVEAGANAIEGMDGEVYSSVVIPSPHLEICRIVEQYRMENLLPQGH